jgi:hypothetical protein
MKSYDFPGFYAESALGPTVFHYRLSARSGQSIVVPARLPDDVEDCFADCAFYCAGMPHNQREACIAQCRQNCFTPQRFPFLLKKMYHTMIDKRRLL